MTPRWARHNPDRVRAWPRRGLTPDHPDHPRDPLEVPVHYRVHRPHFTGTVGPVRFTNGVATSDHDKMLGYFLEHSDTFRVEDAEPEQTEGTDPEVPEVPELPEGPEDADDHGEG